MTRGLGRAGGGVQLCRFGRTARGRQRRPSRVGRGATFHETSRDGTAERATDGVTAASNVLVGAVSCATVEGVVREEACRWGGQENLIVIGGGGEAITLLLRRVTVSRDTDPSLIRLPKRPLSEKTKVEHCSAQYQKGDGIVRERQSCRVRFLIISRATRTNNKKRSVK